jgi:hypothetical protein
LAFPVTYLFSTFPQCFHLPFLIKNSTFCL